MEAGSDLLGALLFRLHHEDRIQYDNLTKIFEFNTGAVLHMLTNLDLEKAGAESLGSAGCDKFLCMKLPVPTFSTMHVVHGPNCKSYEWGKVHPILQEPSTYATPYVVET